MSAEKFLARNYFFNIFRPQINFPEKVFWKEFSNYLFFDVDVCTCFSFISWLQESKVCSSNEVLKIYEPNSGSYLGELSPKEDWVDSIRNIALSLTNANEVNGLVLILVDDSLVKWVVYQLRSVDMGFIAFSSDKEFAKAALQSGFFFGCNEIKEWLLGRTERDLDLRSNFGQDYLMRVIKNYC